MNLPRFSLFSRVLAALGATMLATAVASGAPALQTVPGHVPAAAAGLRATGRLPASQQLHLAVGLPWRNREALTHLLQRLYDPASPDFHQFLSPELFAAQFGPAPEDYQTLSNYFIAHGLKIAATHSNRVLLDVTGSVADVEKLLRVTMRVYPHPSEARTFFAPDAEPSWDAAVPILHIAGLDDFLRPHPMNLRPSPAAGSKRPQFGSGPGAGYLGNDFRAAYLPGVTLTGAGQSLGLLEFDGYFPSDVTAYRTLAGGPAVPLKNILLDDFNGVPGPDNDEVALDIDMANDMAPGLSAILVYEGLAGDDILNRMATDGLAKQLSASWTYPVDPLTEEIFQQLGAQGQSFFNAAGDSDAYSGAVAQPADDPNITIVGGTTLETASAGGAWFSETVWNWNNGQGTGGGISQTYPLPSWQQGINFTASRASTNFRNLPDVALTADNVFLIYNDGATGIFGGTSCATPLWAALTALINQQALANGRPVQGFLNPALYALCEGSNYAAGFHDITVGNNVGIFTPGFFAAPGYDLCTGWGTPRGTNLINLLAPLDDLRVFPGSGFNAAGGPGGPFAVNAETFVLTNAGAFPLFWTASPAAPWLTATPPGGPLLPGGPATVVTVSLNAAASNEVAGVYSASVWFTNLGNHFAQSRAFTLAIIAPPVLTQSPSSQAVPGNAPARFTVAAVGGAPLAYQWQQNGVNLADGANLSGSSSSALTIAAVGLSNIGSYTVVVSNPALAVTSAPPAVLAITPSAPVIVTPPAGSFALLGSTVNLTVTAEGSLPLAYQWQFDTANLSDGGDVSGSTNSTLTLSPVAAANSGTYTVTVSNALGTAVSTGAVVTVYAQADTELIQNGGFETGDFSFWTPFGNSGLDTVSTGVLFTHSGLYGAELGPYGTPGDIAQTVPTTPGASYLLSLWLDSPDGAVPNEFQADWNGIPLLDLTNLPGFGWSNFQFQVTATATTTTLELGFRNDASFFGLDDVSLKPLLNPAGPPLITAQPPAQTFAAAGTPVALTVGAAGAPPLAYQWQSNNVPIAGATAATLSFPSVTTGQSGVYNVMVSNGLGLAASSNAVLTVLAGAPLLVGFDDLGPANAPVPAGYAGLDWSNFYSVDTLISAPDPSGYLAGTLSPPNAAFNQYGAPAFITNAAPFAFLSAWMTAAWNDNLRLEVKGYASNALVYDQAWFLRSETPTFIPFNCVGVTNIEFSTSGGTPDPNYVDSGFEFVMDNASVIVAAPPAPGNDDCPGAILISGDVSTNIQSTAGATSANDPVPVCLAGFTNGVWYQFTAPASGELMIDTSASDFPAVVAIYTGACGALIPVACNQNSVGLVGGETVYLLVGALGNVSGTLVLRTAFSSATTGPPFILSSPSSASVAAGQAASFTVSAEGQQPLNYYWQRNGTSIPGATGSSYTDATVQLTDSGAQFTCLVSNALGATSSAPALLLVSPPGELVANGGFETGDFSYWTQSGNFSDNYVNNFYVHSGQFGAALGPEGALSYLSQVLATAPGQLYRVSLWLNSPDGLTNNEFSVAWAGATLLDEANLPRLGWTNFQFTVPAPASATLLQLGFRDDPSFLGLDDVSVMPLLPVLQNAGQSSSTITLQWSALPAHVYQVQSTADLAQPSWTNVGPAITASNYTMTASETIGSDTAQFYRIVFVQ